MLFRDYSNSNLFSRPRSALRCCLLIRWLMYCVVVFIKDYIYINVQYWRSMRVTEKLGLLKSTSDIAQINNKVV